MIDCRWDIRHEPMVTFWRVVGAVLIILSALFTTYAAAQQVEPQADAPKGAPYHVEASDPTLVPLRDYLSSRIDQLRVEVFDRIEEDQKHALRLLDERDRQYAQRFEAQQEALGAALLAQKEAVANALSAAKEAVNKAEEASNKRFDSVNEFRSQLNDQALTFMSKDTAEARFAAVEEKTSNNTNRLNDLQATSAGSSSTWALIGGAILLFIAIGTFAMSAQRFRKEA